MAANLYRGPFIDASYQVLVHLAKWLQRRRFLEIDQPETRIFNGGHVCLRIGKKLEILKRAFHRDHTTNIAAIDSYCL
jgi:hypothetical protein